MHYTDSSMTVPVFGIWQDAVIFIWHAKVLIVYAMHGDSRYTWTNIITKNNRLYWSVISRCHKNRSQLWLIVIAIQCIFFFFGKLVSKKFLSTTFRKMMMKGDVLQCLFSWLSVHLWWYTNLRSCSMYGVVQTDCFKTYWFLFQFFHCLGVMLDCFFLL